MARWIKPTEAHLRAYLSDQELTNLRGHLSDDDKLDTVAQAIDNAVHFVRGKVAQNRMNKMARGATLPASLIRFAMQIAVMDCMSRPAASIIDASGARKAAADRAHTELDKLARGDKDSIRIEQPDTDEIDSTQSDRFAYPGAIKIIYTNGEPQMTRAALDGAF